MSRPDPTSDEEKEKFEFMERRDEEQIEKSILGQYLDECIYDFTTKDGRRVTGLSWVGVKEIAAKMGSIRVDEKPDIIDQGDSWFVMVKAEDRLRDSSRWGVSTQFKKLRHKDGSLTDDEFAIQKAMSKAQRNAIRQLIPERWIQQLIDRFLQGERKFEPEKVIEMKGEHDSKQVEIIQESEMRVPITKEPMEGTTLKQFPLNLGTVKVGMVNVVEDMTEAAIVPEIAISAKDSTIANFLVPRVLEAMVAKHAGVEYQVMIEGDNMLRAVVIRGPLNDQLIRDLVNASRWAFSKALEKKKLSA